MSTPVRGPDGPLGYAPRWARMSGGGRAETAFQGEATRNVAAVDELAPQRDLKPPRVVMPLREGASARDTLMARDATTRDTTTREATGRNALLPQGADPEQDDVPVKDPSSYRDSKLPRVSRTVQAVTSDAVWKRKKRQPVFEGDAALRELRSRLALSPDQMPEPPLYHGKTPIFAVVARLMGVMVLAAGGALGFLWITAPHAAAPDGQAASPSAADMALVSYRSVEAAQAAPAAENIAPRRSTDTTSNQATWRMANYTRGTDGVGTSPAAQAPGISVPRAPASRAVPAPAAVAAPPPAPPRPTAAPPPAASPPTPAAAASLPSVPVPASRVPAAPLATPVAAPTSPPQQSNVASPDRDEVAALLARARSYLSAGDVAAARLVLRRAAERDDPQAALALGGTYDPSVLKRLGIINFHADPTQAREWYRRAAELGSADASLRLDQLVQTDR